MKRINDETMKAAVNQVFVENILSFSEIDIYRATSGIQKRD